MDLILWRHAEAEEGSNDLARELTRKGQQQAGLMAAWLRLRLPRDFQLLASAWPPLWRFSAIASR